MVLAAGADALRGHAAGPAFCTIVAKNYLAQARALARSLRRHHPDLPLYVLLVDDPAGLFDPAAEDFVVLTLERLELPARADLCLGYELLELCTAVKPPLLQWIFAQGHSKIVYLDPDVWVYRPLAPLLAALDEADVVLTPHLTAPLPDTAFPDERLMLMVGAYNLGFLALARAPAVDDFLAWWWRRCQAECLVDMPRGLFLDQKWMNLAPSFLDRVRVLRHPGYNVAHWNLASRVLSGTAENPLVNGEPLYFLHASSVDALDPPRLACPQTRFGLLDGEPLLSMLRNYSGELLAAGYQACRSWPYSHGSFRDGQPIPAILRRLFRTEARGRFADPFATGPGSFRDWALSGTTPPVRAPRGRAVPPYGRVPPRHAPDQLEAAPSGRKGERAARGPGATVIGPVRAESGMGELARSTVRALRAAQYPHNTVDVHHPAHRHADLLEAAPPAEARLPFTLAVVTPADAAAPRAPVRLAHPASYVIGYWPWELETFRVDLGDVFEAMDEVWTLSRFSAAAVATASPVPVHAIWPALPDVTAPRSGNAPLDPAEYNFLFVYDLLSETDRKNPEGLLRAFGRAFRPGEPVRLTLKVINGALRTDELRRVADAAHGLRVTLLDRYLERSDHLRLMGACDAYVSLHRAEGFGFTLVEAMALGKPVVATFYSGNTEYMTPWNCFPVPWRMTEVAKARGAYRPGDPWAEPDLEAAAALMRRVFEEPEAARAVGSRARRDVNAQLSPATTGARMAARLRTIEARAVAR